MSAVEVPAEDICPQSIRVDGPHHSWVFDGDDPRICCVFCGEIRDALTGEVIQRGEDGAR